MATKPTTPEKAKAASAREDRLKAALKANMARRKAQTRARSSATEADDGDNTGEKGQN